MGSRYQFRIGADIAARIQTVKMRDVPMADFDFLEVPTPLLDLAGGSYAVRVQALS